MWLAFGDPRQGHARGARHRRARLDDARRRDPARRRAARACRGTLIAIAGFALRYLQVVLDELRRMRLARTQRGDDPRWLWQARGTGRMVGALVVRTFERGERVHVAMLARGYDGSMPVARPRPGGASARVGGVVGRRSRPLPSRS